MEPIPDKTNFIDFLDAPTEFNPLKQDLENLITDSGQTVGGNNFQFSRAVSGYSAKSTFYTDAGAVNAYVLSPLGSFKAPHSYSNGMIARFRAANTNTGASTVNVAGLGVIPIKNPDGDALNPNDIVQNHYVELWYFGGNFILLLSSGSGGDDAQTGDIVFHGGNVTQRVGWIMCDGAEWPQTTYPDLFAVIGTNWNTPAPGPGNFRVPDLRGRVPRGLDDGAGLDPGRVFGTYQLDELASHRHNVGSGGNTGTSSLEPAGGPTRNLFTQYTGGTETRMKNAASRWWIKT